MQPDRPRLSFACTRTWSELDGDDAQRRHCTDCDTPVHRLDTRRRRDAAQLLADHTGGSLCVVYATNAGGVVEHAATPRTPSAPARQVRGVSRLTRAALAVLVALPAAAMTACGGMPVDRSHALDIELRLADQEDAAREKLARAGILANDERWVDASPDPDGAPLVREPTTQASGHEATKPAPAGGTGSGGR